MVSKCKPLTRGGQFDCYGDGSMVAHGSSAPSGGGPGSAYGPVAHFEANSLEAINIIFNEIEASAVSIPGQVHSVKRTDIHIYRIRR